MLRVDRWPHAWVLLQPASIEGVAPVNALTERALSIALSQVGVREETRNRGKVIDGYNAEIGHDPTKADPWCSIFVACMFLRASKQLGIRCPVPLTAGCWSLDERSPAAVRTKQAAPGAIFLTKGHHHTGFVESLDTGNPATFWEVSGNTNDNGSAEGIGVFRRQRRYDQIELYLDYGVIDLATLVPAALS